MAQYDVAARGVASVRVDADSWLSALGLALEEIGRVDDLKRLACEVLPNGTVIARDVSTGIGYVVQRADEIPPPPEEDALTPEEDLEIELLDQPPSEIVPSDVLGLDDAVGVLEACEVALDRARASVPAESGSVLLVSGERLKFMAVLGPHADALIGARLPLGVGVAGRAMDQRRAVILTDASGDPRHYSEIDKKTGHRTRDMVCVPIVAGDKVYGVIEMLDLLHGGRFTHVHVRALRSVASALADRLAGKT